MQRVAERVSKGGHDIPTPTIKRRYIAGITNLFTLFMKEVDYWDIYDNSEYPRKQIACGGKNVETIVYEDSIFANIQCYVK